ncbi:MAG TPA: histidinol dehydrogenase, partial [Spirochaetia bacterium]|nr:histidinol dehydrogenase [Spirochaetia bacterium]
MAKFGGTLTPVAPTIRVTPMQIRVLAWSSLAEQDKRTIIERSEQDIAAVFTRVREIIEKVRAEGDAALIEYTRQFNDADLSGIPLAVSEREFEKAEKSLDAAVKDAIRFCVSNVRAYHEQQLPGAMSFGEVLPGVYAGERATPIRSVALYAPRGKGSFPSSTYMMAVPA